MMEKDNKIRIQKIIADAGVCSRRKAEELIEKGAVTVNGKRAKLGDKADPDLIMRDFGLSKNGFKKAVGVLYKARRVVIREDGISLV